MLGYADIAQNANGIQQELNARAFIFANREAPSNRVVYVSAEIGFMSSIARQEVIRRLDEAGYIDKITNKSLYTAENVMVSATHTHSGPGGFSDEFMYQITSLGLVPLAREALIDAITNAIIIGHVDLESALKSPTSSQKVTINTGNLANAGINRSPHAYMRNPSSERANYSSNTDQTMTAINIWGSDNALRGHVNFFAVHGTSLHGDNFLVSGDNKGFAAYIWELEERLKKGREPHGFEVDDFVAAFSQSNSGDVSPNLVLPRCIDTGEPCDGSKNCCNGDVTKCLGQGPGEPNGKDGFYAAEYIGRMQYEKAKLLSTPDVGVETRGPILFRHAWVDMSKVTVELSDKSIATTCGPAMGYSFLAGTTDGKGSKFSYQGYNKPDPQSHVLSFLRDIINFRPITTASEQCHHPKIILLNTGENTSPYPWQPRVLPLQIFLIGRKIVLLGLPSEITTMAGRRLRETVRVQLTRDSTIDADAHVVIVGLANAYASYVTTREEYQVQRYEGGSTAYGPNTLLAYQKLFGMMAQSFKDPGAVPVVVSGGEPSRRPEKELSFLPSVILDTAIGGGGDSSFFGRVLEQPDKMFYTLPSSAFSRANAFYDVENDLLGDGDVAKRIKNTTLVIEAKFQCSHPRNGAGINPETGMETFMVVEKRKRGSKIDEWVPFLTESEWDTKFEWRRSRFSDSICTVSWDVGRTAPVEAGMYRFRMFGIAKTILGEKKWNGVTLSFWLVEERAAFIIQN
ncbi:hypothetical protein HK100_002377 [Physocladia obscura]|uniref:Neutral ceramidase n=1 Tax=Physocladia obscura TaxID=109957 RepID=A0AAD5XDW2_9FUNG|nr:hypothetical protein HK100_002377 [Physocladia obscura]